MIASASLRFMQFANILHNKPEKQVFLAWACFPAEYHSRYKLELFAFFDGDRHCGKSVGLLQGILLQEGSR